MRFTIFGIALVLALALTTGTASATLVDDFFVGSNILDLPDGPVASSDGGVGPVGPFTTRTLSAISDGVNPLLLAAGGGVLTMNPFFNTTGTGQVLYVGESIDFSLATAFTLNYLGASAPGGDIFIEVSDGIWTSSLISFTGGATLGTTGTTLSVSTGHPGFAGVNFSTIERIHLVIDSGAPTGNGMAFSAFRTTDIPEPTTMLLMGIGLVALGVIGRRRRSMS